MSVVDHRDAHLHTERAGIKLVRYPRRDSKGIARGPEDPRRNESTRASCNELIEAEHKRLEKIEGAELRAKHSSSIRCAVGLAPSSRDYAPSNRRRGEAVDGTGYCGPRTRFAARRETLAPQ